MEAERWDVIPILMATYWESGAQASLQRDHGDTEN